MKRVNIEAKFGVERCQPETCTAIPALLFSYFFSESERENNLLQNRMKAHENVLWWNEECNDGDIMLVKVAGYKLT